MKRRNAQISFVVMSVEGRSTEWSCWARCDCALRQDTSLTVVSVNAVVWLDWDRTPVLFGSIQNKEKCYLNVAIKKVSAMNHQNIVSTIDLAKKEQDT